MLTSQQVLNKKKKFFSPSPRFLNENLLLSGLFSWHVLAGVVEGEMSDLFCHTLSCTFIHECIIRESVQSRAPLICTPATQAHTFVMVFNENVAFHIALV